MESKAYQSIRTGERRITLLGVELQYLNLLAIFFAALGWLVENTAKLISQGYIDNRFHTLPFIGTYGFIVFALHLLFGSPDRIAPFGRPLFREDTVKTRLLSNLICISVICAVVFFGELLLGNAVEHFTGVQLWDYSKQAFHVTQYAGLLSTAGFGAGAYTVFRFAYRPALQWMQRRIPYRTAQALNATLGVLILMDSAYMVVQTFVFKTPALYWTLYLR